MSIFKDLQRTRGICSNCFRRVRDVWEATHWVDTHNGETWIRPMRDSLGTVNIADVNPTEVTQMDVHEGRKTVCECGVEYGSMTVRPLDKKTFFRRAGRLADRLEEEVCDMPGLEFRRERFFDRLEELKSDPDEQFKDDDMYRRATEESVTRSTQNGKMGRA